MLHLNRHRTELPGLVVQAGHTAPGLPEVLEIEQRAWSMAGNLDLDLGRKFTRIQSRKLSPYALAQTDGGLEYIFIVVGVLRIQHEQP